MKTRIRAALNGVWLDELDSEIVLQDIRESATGISRQTAVNGSRFGTQITGQSRGSLDVEIVFGIFRPRDEEGRASVMEKVRAWCVDGGVLTVSYRPDRQLRVVCEKLPEMGSASGWTDNISLTLRAYAVPCWESREQDSWTATGSGRVLCSIVAPGTLETPATVSLQNAGSVKCDDLTLQCGEQVMRFTSLGLKPGETLTVDETGEWQRIVITGQSGERSVMDRRTADSDDRLLVQPGTGSVTATVSVKAVMTVSVRGRWA